MKETVKIEGEYLTLGQLLKETGTIDTGGMAKWFLQEYTVYVNDEADERRGRKLYPGDVVRLEGGETFVLE
ncbi:S4 domain-containing protein YaaA [Alteribacter natronophilus]|uniref:S4 domain-containing protein YaaA n=1 Tax=Alteribacter natronophilus TaxID=2583810 RepID=UPI00110E6510|nr:S4 domain-containing protein YaaA [Alteribacter natronophilus]TMW71997.1 S4 domain-containing protein YaaA [Alteribacter natronophilus]